jgi:hypothetical protein
MLPEARASRVLTLVDAILNLTRRGGGLVEKPEVEGSISWIYILSAMTIGLHAFRSKFSGPRKPTHTIAMLNFAVWLAAAALFIVGIVRRRETLPFREFLAIDCRSVSNLGSGAILMTKCLCCAEEAGLQQVELAAPVHLAFDEFE